MSWKLFKHFERSIQNKYKEVYQREYQIDLVMETTLQRQTIELPAPSYNDFDVDDQQGEELFNQISIQQQPPLINQQSHQQEPNQISQTPKKIKSFKIMKRNMELDSDQIQHQNFNQPQKLSQRKTKGSREDKKKRKQLKKLKKKLKKQRIKQKQRLKNGSGLKRLKKQGDQDEKNSNKWSGQSSQSYDEDSDVSSDSLLHNLNPRKKNSSLKKTEKKQGFSLKQLGNNPELQYDNDQIESEDSQYHEKNGKAKRQKLEKKQVSKNQQILKSLLQIGLCVDQQNEENKKEGYQYDNGLEQMQNMKNSKKKGVRIKNKLLLDIDIDEDADNNEPLPKQIQLEVKPRTNLGSSKITNSFLNKAQRIKKVRGMQSQIQNEQFQKIMSFKAKQSMVKLISQKQIQEADQIQLDVKVPQVIKGREELNNTMFLKRMSSTLSKNKAQPKTAIPASKNQFNRNESKTKLSRFDFFRSVVQDVKARRSRQITEQLIKNNFKVTKLEEIEEMRKKNQQKRKKDALMGSDRQQQEQQSPQKKMSLQADDILHENKFKFLNFRVQVNKEKNQTENENEKQKQIEKVQSQLMEGAQKQNFQQKEVKTEKLPDKQYEKLIRMEQQGYVEDDNLRQEQNSSQMKNQLSNKEDRDELLNELDIQSDNENHSQPEENQNQINEDLLNQAEPVEIEVDVEISNEQNEQEDSHLSEQEVDEESKKQQRNEQHQQYLSFLEAEGIELKKNAKKYQNQEKRKISEKENNQFIENNQGAISFESDARRQFRKLRKLATIIKTKKRAEIKVKRAGEFFDQEAEEGSDNEDHDHQVKNINYDEEQKQYEGLDLDADLEELIDNAVDIDEQNEQLAFRKYMEDVKIQDRQELRRIMKGDFKRNRQNDHIVDEMEQDQKKRIERMQQIQQYLKEKQQEDGKGLYMQNQNKPEMNSSQNESNEEDKIDKNASKNPVRQEIEVVDEMNEQNLKRYLDDKIVETFRTTTIVRRPIVELPQSYKRTKKTQMRNTMKPKEIGPQNFKLKKTTSHLNEMIMKNKQKIKPLPFLKGYPLPVRK